MPAIWGFDVNGTWQPLTPSRYPNEEALHDLVEQAPHTLPLAGSPRLAVVGREVQLGIGRADLIAVESSGRLVLIEVKLSGNAEARRAVVAQVLSYAAYLQGLDVDYLQAATLRTHLAKRGYATVLDAVLGTDQQVTVDPAAFEQGLERSLADGRFRLVIVLDDVPDELTQLVGYLQSLTDRVVVDLITLSSYDVRGARVLVPQRVEPAPRARELSTAEAVARQASALYPGADEFRAAIAQAPDDQQELLCRLTDWAEQLDAEGLVSLATYRGKNDITTLLPRLPGEGGLVTIYQEPRAAYVQLWPTVFQRRASNAVAAVEAALGAPVKHGARISQVPHELLLALAAAYREAAETTASPPPDAG